jgi:hypothetical protein
MSTVLALLIPIAAIAVFVLGAIGVLKLQNATLQRDSMPMGDAAPNGFQQSPGETREAYVRRLWQRPGVVANGVTLVDLYDRIGALEGRLAEAERQLNTPS